MSLTSDIKSMVASMDLELYDTAVVNEFDETIFRVSVISKEFEDTKRKSVPLDTYVELTHLLSPLLDVNPPVSGEYRLEVGSPGIERKLTKLDHFQKSIGENVSLTTTEIKKLKAKLIGVDGEKLTFENEEGIFEVDFHDVKKAKTYFEW
jgi:ribosome maturation factor RimP